MPQQPFITLQETREALGITDDADDARLVHMMAAACDHIRRVTRRDFGGSVQNERHEGGETVILLRHWPVEAMTSVEDTYGSSFLAEDTDYRVEDGGMLRRLPIGATWTRGLARWHILYTAAADVPGDIRSAAFEMIGALRDTQGGKTAVKDGDYAATFAKGGVPDAVAAMLAPHIARPL